MPSPARLSRDALPPESSAQPIRLMIVDDSIVVRSIFARVLDAHPDFMIVASAANADQALRELDSISVDIILLDLEMPGTDGLTALPTLIARSHGARVLIVSAAAADGAHATVRALTIGAADTLPKPGAGAYGSRFADQLVEKLLRIGRKDMPPPAARVLPVAVSDAAPSLALRDAVEGPIECVAIGSSTGGVSALTELFRALPAHCDAPVLITQHLPPVFMPFFAAQLTSITGRPTSVATEGARLRRGEILVAPGEAHIALYRGPDFVRIQLDHSPSSSGCRPSADPMFASVGECFGPTAIGVVLSGMGRDGALGAAKLVAAGAELLAQDAATSVVWGMPGAVARAGLASIVAAPLGIAARLGQRNFAARAGTLG